jgi:hypothetical protein
MFPAGIAPASLVGPDTLASVFLLNYGNIDELLMPDVGYG